MTFLPEGWMKNIAAAFAPSPMEVFLRESQARQWARLEAENPRKYDRERRRERIRKWCRAHHFPVPWWMRYPRLPADPRFENWHQPCVAQYITFPIARSEES